MVINVVLMDGKGLSAKIKDEIASEISLGISAPVLAVISVGEDVPSQIYVNNKKKACEYVGIGFLHFKFDADVSEDKIIDKIKKLNKDKSINGIIVQLPLPDGFDKLRIINSIDESKDVDGLTFNNEIKRVNAIDALTPCTPKGIFELLDYYKIDIESKHVVIVGRSALVGRPLMVECLRRNATVTVCHSKTKDLGDITKNADILIVAVGHKYLIDESMVKKDAVIVDVGISRENGKIYGDVNPNVENKCSYLTPVPGGVGPMTVTMLMKNTLEAFKRQNKTLD